MSVTRLSFCCSILLAWASLSPVHSQDPDPRPGRASLRDSSVRAQSPVAPPQPEQDYYYAEQGDPGYSPMPSARGYVPFDPFGTRFSYRADLGEGPGWAQGFQSLNVFAPIVFEPDRSLLFLDGRVISTFNGGVGANVGAGVRTYSPEQDRVFGGSFWYDYDDSNFTNYDQWGISLESLGRYFDFRINAYVPSNDNQNVVSSHLDGRVFFTGNNIGLGNLRTVENALRGGDLEIGGALPFFGDYGLRSYIGGYYFQAPGVESTVGVKYRTEVMVTEDVQLQFGASSDKLFGQNFYGAVTFFLPDGRPQRILSRQPVRERLYANVERNFRLNVFRETRKETIKAINPNTGLPYIVHHVDNGAAGGGDGSVKDPFNILNNAGGGADIIFVHHNAVDGLGDPIISGLDTGIVLADNQRLLGQGTEHLFTDLNYGTFVLPGNDGGPLPIITNTTGDVVTLANNNEVSGLQIGAAAPFNAAGNGIFGDTITDFNINRNVIQNSGLAGISLVNASGTGSITDNTLNTNTLENIAINNSNAADLTLQIANNDAQTSLAGIVVRGSASNILASISGNNVSNNLDMGLELQAANGGTVTASVSDNIANNNGGQGIQLTADAGTLNVELLNNSANTNAFSGLNLTSTNLGVLNLIATDNAFNNNGGDGASLLADGGSINLVDMSFNTFNSNTGFGLLLDADNGGSLNGTIFSNSIQLNGDGGVSSTINNGAQSTLALASNTISDNTGIGMSFSALNTGVINNLVDTNQISGNAGAGVILAGSSNSQVTFNLNGNNIVSNAGIGFDSSITDSQSTVNVTNNIFDANQDAGIRLSYTGAAVSTHLVDGNTIQNTTDIGTTATPTGQGILVDLHGTGAAPNVESTISNNTVQNSVSDGLLFTLNDGSSNLNVNDVINNSLLGNGGDGLSMQLNLGSFAVLNANNNLINTQTAARTGVNGVNLDLRGTSQLVASLSGNTIDGSSDGTNFSLGHGVLMNVRQDSILDATLSQNLIRENGLDGVHVGPDPLSNGQIQGGFNAAQGTATIGVTLNDNIIELNRDDGVQVSVAQVTEGLSGMTGVGNYTLIGNTIRQNGVVNGAIRTGEGIDAEVRSGIMNLVVANNNISDNAADGMLLRNSMGAAVDPGVQVPNILLLDNSPKSILNATIDGNTISGNGNRGINLRHEDITANAATQGLGGIGNVSITNNNIFNNNDEGILVVTNNQRDDSLFGPWPSVIVDENNPFNDPTAIANRYPAFATFPDYFIDFANADTYTDLRLEVVGNTISSNGGGNAPDALGITAGDGMMILVGTASYVHADVRDNQFSGNFMDDFRTDSFVAGPETPLSNFDDPADGSTRVFLDHISLLDLRFTGNTGNSIGGVTSSSDGNRIIGGVLKQGRFNDADPDQTAPQQEVKFSRRRTDYFRVEDTPNPAGSVLNGTNFFSAADSLFPRNNFLTTGYVQAPIGSLFP